MLEEVKRSYAIGDEWLYYKIYTGYKTSDLILIELIEPLIESLKSKKIIEKWFFIRYADPEYHLRLRFNFKKKENILIIIDELNSCFKEFSGNGLIWKIQVESYERELKRYGENSIEFAENIFFYDSEMMLKLVKIIDDNSSEELRWLIALKTMDNYFNDFHFTIEEKLEFVRNQKTVFNDYYKTSSKSIGSKFNIKYNSNKKIIKSFMTEDSYNDEIQYDVVKNIKMNSFNNKKTISDLFKLRDKNDIKIDFTNLLSSYIHMHLNRLFKTRNTLNEYACYDFLYRYYMSIIKQKEL